MKALSTRPNPPAFEFLARRRSEIATTTLAGYESQERNPVTISDRDRAVHGYVAGVSGSGKSRFLQHLMFSDIARGRPICLIDPMGDLYRATTEFIASCLERADSCGFSSYELLDKFVFLDASRDDNPVTLNPLEPHDDESSEQQVDDLMRSIERLLGGMEEQRKLRNVLRGAFMMTVELNRLPRDVRVALLGDRPYPLDLFFAADILNMDDEERLRFMNALPKTTRLKFRRQYWEFFARGGQSAKTAIVQSSWNVFQYLLDDSLVLRVLNASRSTLHIPDLLRSGKSLICHLPIGQNLRGASFLGKFLTTKIQNAAYRRPEAEWKNRMFVYIDEFHHFVDQALADALTNLRKFGISIVTAHQSLSQPPFDSREGQALLQTIKANSRMKAIFRLDRADAEVMAREVFELTLRRKNFEVVDRSVSRSQQRTAGSSRTSGRSDGSGENWSDSYSWSRSQRQYDLQHDQDTVTDASRRGSGRSTKYELSSSTQQSESQTTGTSETTTTRTVYHTMEGERELMVNALQKLADRRCYLLVGAIGAENAGNLIETPYVPDELYSYRVQNFPEMMLSWQRLKMERQIREMEKKDATSARRSDEGRVIAFSAPATERDEKEEESLDDVREDEGVKIASAVPVAPAAPRNFPFVD